jgi:sarcosine oxidase
MSVDFEYCVLGAGVVGSATAYMLARGGNSVLLLEQFEFGHERGSSHGESRITRYSYDQPTYVQMAKRAFPLWQELSKESGANLYLKTGGIDLDEEEGRRIAACIQSLKQENIPFEELDAVEIRRRFPQFHIPHHTQGLYQADTGILNASLCVNTLQQQAARNGAILAEVSPVVKIEFEGKNVKLTTPNAKFKARKLVIAAGGWAGPLLQGLGLKLPLEVTQEQYAYFKPLKPEAFSPDRFPVFIHYGGVGSGGIGWYGFPQFGFDGIKSSIHKTGKVVSAEKRDFQVDQRQLEQLAKLMAELLPDAAGEIVHANTCLYTNSPDTHFVIDHLPGRDNAVFFTGCSGHAFKFGMVIAEMLISHLNKEAYSVPLDMFRRKRNF